MHPKLRHVPESGIMLWLVGSCCNCELGLFSTGSAQAPALIPGVPDMQNTVNYYDIFQG